MIALAFLLAYLFGAIPSGYLLGKLIKHIDIREYGSGNIGTTNVFRVLGVKQGILVFILDFLKGFFAIYCARHLLVNILSTFQHEQAQLLIMSIGIVAILGHIFPFWLRFKGGKGIATGAGVFGSIMPYATIAAVITFFSILFIFKMVSLASLSAVTTLFIIELIYNCIYLDEIPFLLLTLFILVLIVIRHRENIKRIRAGKEPKIILKRKK